MEHFDTRLGQFFLDLGRRIRMARERRGLTQVEAAGAAELTPNVWSKLENGRFVNPGLRTLARVAWSWDGSIADLLSEGPRPVDSPRLRHRAQLAALVRRADDDQLRLMVALARAVVTQEAASSSDREA
jgi:transcriptional regulator with XRE-family HTH domain